MKHGSSEALPFDFEGAQCATHTHYFGQPDGTPVLALHGFTGSGADFAALADSAKTSWCVAAPDLPGHGGYQAPPNLAYHGFDAARTVVASAMGAAGWSESALLGYSMGARVAIDVALNRPEMTAALVLISGRPGLHSEQERVERKRWDERWASTIEADGVEGFLEAWQSQPLIATQVRTPEPHLSGLQSRRLAARGEGWAMSLRASGTGVMDSLWDRLGEIKCPVLLVVGEEDVKFRTIAEQMSQRLVDSELCVVAGQVGHAPHLESPADTAHQICKFLSRRT